MGKAGKESKRDHKINNASLHIRDDGQISQLIEEETHKGRLLTS